MTCQSCDLTRTLIQNPGNTSLNRWDLRIKLSAIARTRLLFLAQMPHQQPHLLLQYLTCTLQTVFAGVCKLIVSHNVTTASCSRCWRSPRGRRKLGHSELVDSQASGWQCPNKQLLTAQHEPNTPLKTAICVAHDKRIATIRVRYTSTATLCFGTC